MNCRFYVFKIDSGFKLFTHCLLLIWASIFPIFGTVLLNLLDVDLQMEMNDFAKSAVSMFSFLVDDRCHYALFFG